MNTKGCLLALGLASACGLAMANEDYDLGRQHWRQGEYREAYIRLWRYRAQPYGRTAQVDYMLGTSGCRLDDLRDWGGNVLAWVLHRYPLSLASHDIVQRELRQCRSAGTIAAVDAASAQALDGLIGASARASGKSFYWADQNEVVNAYPAQRIRDIPLSELVARRVAPGHPEQARTSVLARVPGFSVAVYDRYVLASRAPRPPEVMDGMARHLERYLGFLDREYAIGLPDSYVTVYLLPSQSELAKLADRLHGLRIGRATIGYAFRDDLSVLAAVPDGIAVGTIKHELFHVAVRSRFGDIPQWLDEGIASLYEVSDFRGERVVGLPNWRGQVLIRLERLRPSIRQLLTSNWFAFEQIGLTREFQRDPDGSYPSAEAMAATLATARYFTLYLQGSGQLSGVFDDFRKQVPGTQARDDPAAAAVAVIEKRLGKSIDAVDRDFIAWFKALEKPAR